jgi:hypothetical protein
VHNLSFSVKRESKVYGQGRLNSTAKLLAIKDLAATDRPVQNLALRRPDLEASTLDFFSAKAHKRRLIHA